MKTIVSHPLLDVQAVVVRPLHLMQAILFNNGRSKHQMFPNGSRKGIRTSTSRTLTPPAIISIDAVTQKRRGGGFLCLVLGATYGRGCVAKARLALQDSR